MSTACMRHIHTARRKSDGILFLQNDRSESEPCCISALPEIDKYGAVEICEKYYDAVIYTIAALVLTTFGDTEKVPH